MLDMLINYKIELQNLEMIVCVISLQKKKNLFVAVLTVNRLQQTGNCILYKFFMVYYIYTEYF